MANANVSNVTIRPEEAEHFASLAQDWWNPKGKMASLHQVNPTRLQFIRDAIDRHWQCETAARAPLEGKSALDIGCGAGLVCEPLARLGGEVTGVDAAAENVSAAAAHADAVGLDIRYLAGEVASLDIGEFDLVTCLEVIEHVADKKAFMAQVAERIAPDGLLVMSTPNRTAASRVLLVGAAEAIGYVPKGTHDWNEFIAPEDLEALLGEVGLTVTQRRGIAFSPCKGYHLSDNEALNYIISAKRA